MGLREHVPSWNHEEKNMSVLLNYQSCFKWWLQLYVLLTLSVCVWRRGMCSQIVPSFLLNPYSFHHSLFTQTGQSSHTRKSLGSPPILAGCIVISSAIQGGAGYTVGLICSLSLSKKTPICSFEKHKVSRRKLKRLDWGLFVTWGRIILLKSQDSHCESS